MSILKGQEEYDTKIVVKQSCVKFLTSTAVSVLHLQHKKMTILSKRICVKRRTTQNLFDANQLQKNLAKSRPNPDLVKTKTQTVKF